MSDKYQAKLRNVRVTPRKARLVAGLVRNKPVQTALDTLKFTNKRSAPLIYKLINSAVANATDKGTVDVDRLVVSEIFVDEGIAFKRFLPRAQGRATQVKKRTSHITVRLKEI
ncbi:MAG: 50S ribosomal protein L22 [Oligoflexales bacterium]|nr:50S ribosomal protein L22 [Oligoflexales bacterium]